MRVCLLLSPAVCMGMLLAVGGEGEGVPTGASRGHVWRAVCTATALGEARRPHLQRAPGEGTPTTAAETVVPRKAYVQMAPANGGRGMGRGGGTVTGVGTGMGVGVEEGHGRA